MKKTYAKKMVISALAIAIYSVESNAGSFTVIDPSVTTSGGIRIADLNNDGLDDLVVTSGNQWLIYQNTGSGFVKNAIPGTFYNPHNFVISDINGDGLKDIAISDYGNGDPPAGGSSKIAWLQNTGGMSFQEHDLSNGSGAWSVAVGDFNGDGKQDIVGTYKWDPTLSLFTQNVSGTFDAQSLSGGEYARGLVAGDLNNDGRTDIVAARYWNWNYSMLVNNGGTFQQSTLGVSVSNYPHNVDIVDLNGDGYKDIILNQGAPGTSVLFNDGNLNFTQYTVSTDHGFGNNGYTAVEALGNGHLGVVLPGPDLSWFELNSDKTFTKHIIDSAPAQSGIGGLIDGQVKFVSTSAQGLAIYDNPFAATTQPTLPEPATLALFTIGFAGFNAARRKSERKPT